MAAVKARPRLAPKAAAKKLVLDGLRAERRGAFRDANQLYSRLLHQLEQDSGSPLQVTPHPVEVPYVTLGQTPMGTLVVSVACREMQGVGRVWRLDDNVLLRAYDLPGCGRIGIGELGMNLTVLKQQEVEVRDLWTGRLRRAIKRGAVTTTVTLGDHAVVIDAGKAISVRNINTDKLLLSERLQKSMKVVAVDWSPDQRLLAWAEHEHGCEPTCGKPPQQGRVCPKASLALIDLTSGKRVWSSGLRGECVTDIDIHPGLPKVAVGTDRAVYVVDAEAKRLVVRPAQGRETAPRRRGFQEPRTRVRFEHQGRTPRRGAQQWSSRDLQSGSERSHRRAARRSNRRSTTATTTALRARQQDLLVVSRRCRHTHLGRGDRQARRPFRCAGTIALCRSLQRPPAFAGHRDSPWLRALGPREGETGQAFPPTNRRCGHHHRRGKWALAFPARSGAPDSILERGQRVPLSGLPERKTSPSRHSPNGRSVAKPILATRDARALIVAETTGRAVWLMKRSASKLEKVARLEDATSFAFDDRGEQLAVGRADGSVKCGALARWREAKIIRPSNVRVNVVGFGKLRQGDGRNGARQVLVVGDNSGHIRFIDPGNGRELRVLHAKRPVWHLAPDHQGLLLAASGGEPGTEKSSGWLWDLQTNTIKLAFPGGPVSIARDGKIPRGRP